MPLEGHWQRTNTPLRRLTKRERNVVVAGLATTLVAIAVLLLATAGGGEPTLGPGCIHVGVPGRTGGELVSGCGAEAKALCIRAARYEGRRAELVLDACRERGIDFEPVAGT